MKVIVFGYYGYRNVGDEQLLDESIRLLNEYYPTANVVVASGPRPLPFNTFNRWNLLSWIRQLVGAKAVVFGGGSLFQSQSSTLSLLYYLTIVQWARWFGCRLLFCVMGGVRFVQNGISVWQVQYYQSPKFIVHGDDIGIIIW